MRLKSKLRTFLADTSGAVTIDWVVLAGASVAFGLGVLVIVEPGVDQGSNRVANSIGDAVGENMGVDNTPSLSSRFNLDAEQQ